MNDNMNKKKTNAEVLMDIIGEIDDETLLEVNALREMYFKDKAQSKDVALDNKATITPVPKKSSIVMLKRAIPFIAAVAAIVIIAGVVLISTISSNKGGYSATEKKANFAVEATTQGEYYYACEETETSSNKACYGEDNSDLDEMREPEEFQSDIPDSFVISDDTTHLSFGDSYYELIDEEYFSDYFTDFDIYNLELSVECSEGLYKLTVDDVVPVDQNINLEDFIIYEDSDGNRYLYRLMEEDIEKEN